MTIVVATTKSIESSGGHQQQLVRSHNATGGAVVGARSGDQEDLLAISQTSEVHPVVDLDLNLLDLDLACQFCPKIFVIP